MSSAEGEISDQLERMAALESSLLSEIAAAADELQRNEALDDEQRAEVHTILQALRHDSESHAAIVRSMVSRLGQEACGA